MRRTRKKAFVITKIKPKFVMMPPKRFLGKRIIGVLFLILGSSIISSSFFYFFLIPNFFAKECPVVEKEITADRLQRLIIPVLHLDLTANEAGITDGQWKLPADKVVFLPESSFFGMEAAGTIFGSNNPKVLGTLSGIKKDDLIYLIGSENFRIFKVEEITSVLPSEKNSLAGQEGTLILFSTNDYLKGKRMVIKAKIVR